MSEATEQLRKNIDQLEAAIDLLQLLNHEMNQEYDEMEDE